jgi:hypothetical protein
MVYARLGQRCLNAGVSGCRYHHNNPQHTSPILSTDKCRAGRPQKAPHARRRLTELAVT